MAYISVDPPLNDARKWRATRINRRTSPRAESARAQLEDVRTYNLRHSYASRALDLGESLTMIGKLLRHTQVQTTAQYAHLARDSIQHATARITGSIGGNLSAESGERVDPPPSETHTLRAEMPYPYVDSVQRAP